MNVIEKMLAGEMEMSEFIHLLKTDLNLQAEINALIPKDAKNNPGHNFWKSEKEHDVYIQYDFKLCNMLFDPYHTKFDDSLGDRLNIWGSIKHLYEKTHPDFPFTTKYHEQFNLYLDAVGEAYEGDEEIQLLLENIIQSAIDASAKKGERKRLAKEAIRQAFHIENPRNYPHWIQGGEWPMGKNSPMVYLRRENHGEEVHYIFKDFDTEEERTVIQFY